MKSCTSQKTRTFLEKITSFLSFLNRFISRTKRFHSFNYACLSVELLQSSAADCMVRCSGPYSLLQWTVQSIAVDCNNLPFKRTWLPPGNGLFWLSGNLWLVSFKISYLCLPLFYETRTTPSCHPSGCAYRQL